MRTLGRGSARHAPCAERAWDRYTTKGVSERDCLRPQQTLVGSFLGESSQREPSPSGACGEATRVRGSARGVLEERQETSESGREREKAGSSRLNTSPRERGQADEGGRTRTERFSGCDEGASLIDSFEVDG